MSYPRLAVTKEKSHGVKKRLGRCLQKMELGELLCLELVPCKSQQTESCETAFTLRSWAVTNNLHQTIQLPGCHPHSSVLRPRRDKVPVTHCIHRTDVCISVSKYRSLSWLNVTALRNGGDLQWEPFSWVLILAGCALPPFWWFDSRFRFPLGCSSLDSNLWTPTATQS